MNSEQSQGLASDIVKSIMTPGYTARGVITLMFYAFYALFATLFLLIFLTGGNGHVVALLLLSLCLFFIIKWYIAELEYMKRQTETTTAARQCTKNRRGKPGKKRRTKKARK
ncbi:uncharacterized protein BYT42DRAFT_618353 [Radiomyces spectabilis]|uniref:uncharacterized protein n=1 Tax=Radiomyces spectabilis TaxID=64574 RepID=UPI00221F4AA0|nr:uncharacterized protein BYT42DRAFT_618353 [Radiomyces spectabilis]KAI8365900.1 hypothetical protein BYT42DRAFT_618353 [Radiomyces spectabilis]